MIGFGGRNAGIGLKELKQAIKRAAQDDRIQGIFLEPKYLYSGLSKLYELRQELESFKETGKFIIAYGEYYTESEYYLASVANEISLRVLLINWVLRLRSLGLGIIKAR
jgi:protease-4